MIKQIKGNHDPQVTFLEVPRSLSEESESLNRLQGGNKWCYGTHYIRKSQMLQNYILSIKTLNITYLIPSIKRHRLSDCIKKTESFLSMLPRNIYYCKRETLL